MDIRLWSLLTLNDGNENAYHGRLVKERERGKAETNIALCMYVEVEWRLENYGDYV